MFRFRIRYMNPFGELVELEFKTLDELIAEQKLILQQGDIFRLSVRIETKDK